MEEAHKYLLERPEMVTRSFQVTDISLALDGSENSLFRNDTCLKFLTEDVQAEKSEDGDKDPFQDLNDSELED